jgi:hypothetical protein
MRRRPLIAVVVLMALTRETSAEPVYHLKSPSTVTTEKGNTLKLPPGYFLDERAWQERDLELKQAQEARTRLKAENESLRKSASEYPWLATVVVGAFGVAAGITVALVK